MHCLESGWIGKYAPLGKLHPSGGVFFNTPLLSAVYYYIPTTFPIWKTSQKFIWFGPTFQGTLDFFIELAVLTLHFWAPLLCLVITSGTWMQCFLRTSLHFTYKVQWRTLLSQGSPLLAARWFSWGKSSPPVVVTPLCQWCHWRHHIWVLSSHYPDLN